MKACSELGIKQIFTSYNNSKGNADTERVIRTMKEELIWLHDWQTDSTLIDQLDHWVEKDYNQVYPHSTLGYKSPVEAENAWLKNNINNQNTLLQNAC